MPDRFLTEMAATPDSWDKRLTGTVWIRTVDVPGPVTLTFGDRTWALKGVPPCPELPSGNACAAGSILTLSSGRGNRNVSTATFALENGNSSLALSNVQGDMAGDENVITALTGTWNRAW